MSCSFDFSRFVALLLSADPTATKDEGSGKRNYTVWRPIKPIWSYAGGVKNIVAYKVLVDRFCTADDDLVAQAILNALGSSSHVAFYYERDYEPDTRLIHHSYVCEVR